MTIVKVVDSNSIRRMIRASIRAHMREAVKSVNAAPRSLLDFRHKLADALHEAGAPHDLVEQLDNEDLVDRQLFAEVFSTYDKIVTELKNVPEHHQAAEYRSIAPSYVHDLVQDIVRTHRSSSGLSSVDSGSRNLASRVVKIMLTPVGK